MADVKGAAQLLERFKQSISRNDADAAKRISTEFKIKLTEFTALPPRLERTSTAEQELRIAREMLEHSVIFSIHTKDNAAFDRAFSQLKTYYTDLRELLPPSEQELPIFGLNLLRLLTQNRTAEFHVELELLSPEAHSNSHIEFAKQLEQRLMEGAYAQVLALVGRAPSAHSKWFMEQLAETVRDEMASCCAAAYKHLLLADVAQLLRFKTQKDVVEYCTARGWRVEGQYVWFAEQGKVAAEKPNMGVFHNTLMYARELDRII